MNDFLFTQILTELEDAVGRENCSVKEIDKVTHSVDYFWLSRMWADRGRKMPQADFIGTDVSFISLKLILPHIHRLLKNGGTVAVLIKPQFEAGKSALNKNGIVRDERVRIKIRDELVSFAEGCGFEVAGTTPSPITGGDGNVEYLMYLKKP